MNTFLSLLLVMCCVLWGVEAKSRYGFYRSMGGGAGCSTRRVFGGAAVELAAFPGACVLLDRYWGPHCSATVLAPRWALTAAHCVTPRVAYVKYNTRNPSGRDGSTSSVLYLYRHPKYKVLQEDEGRGMDVTVLHHDVGLVRTRDEMKLKLAPNGGDPVLNMRRYNAIDLHHKDVQVMGFGRTESATMGEELFAVKLRLVFCERGAWFHCICGVSDPASRAGLRGVCSGDSGGPVVYEGIQVGVTSMGPIECATVRANPEEGATSVFTSLYNYANLINATIHDTDAAIRMHKMYASATNCFPYASLVIFLMTVSLVR